MIKGSYEGSNMQVLKRLGVYAVYGLEFGGCHCLA